MKIKYLLYILAISFFISCSEKKEELCCSQDSGIPMGNISGESIFQLESKWTKQYNESILLKQLSGKVVVAAMVFTHCQAACPRIVADLQSIEKMLTEDESDKVSFVLISMDPIRDTPQRFTEFARDYQLKDSWILLSSDENSTMEIANVLNVRVKKLENGGFDHSNTVFIINPQGEIIYRQEGLGQAPEKSVESIRSLIK